MTDDHVAGRTPHERWFWLGASALFAVVFVVAHRGPSGQAGHPTTLAGPVLLWLGLLPWLAGWWAAAAGLGWALSRGLEQPGRPPWAWPLRLALGGAALMLLTWLVAVAGGLRPIPMAALIAAGLGLAAFAWRRESVRPGPEQGDAWGNPKPLPTGRVALACAAPLALLAVAVTLPAGSLWSTEAYGYDVLSYHLNLPRQWVAAGGLVETEHDVYGYLPSLVEVAFAQFMSLRGTEPSAVYLAQGFHASWAVLAAWLVGGFVRRVGSSATAGALAAGVMLAVPWVLVTGSMAYNEMVVVALAAAAAWLALEPPPCLKSWRLGMAVGLAVGAATLAKLTAGFMVAVPIGLMLLITRRWSAAAVAGAAGTLVLTPYLIRNAAWTGNPVFPFATGWLGAGHWTPALTQRWDAGHGLADGETFSVPSLLRQWLLNSGYGAIGGRATPIETQNIARFPREYGVPALWLSVLAAAPIVWRRHRGFRTSDHWRFAFVASLCLVFWLALQLAFWFVLTHQQSRFL
ncbi:MAG: hypothetical protein AAGE65_12055, partial [Planctomycetota bacterium]